MTSLHDAHERDKTYNHTDTKLVSINAFSHIRANPMCLVAKEHFNHQSAAYRT